VYFGGVMIYLEKEKSISDLESPLEFVLRILFANCVIWYAIRF